MSRCRKLGLAVTNDPAHSLPPINRKQTEKLNCPEGILCMGAKYVLGSVDNMAQILKENYKIQNKVHIFSLVYSSLSRYYILYNVRFICHNHLPFY